MKIQILSLLLLTWGISEAQQYGQIPKRVEDKDLTTRLQNLFVSENQFFDLASKDMIVLTIVVREKFLMNKDSLLIDSRKWYNKIKTAIGPSRINEYVTISYIGKLTDAFNKSFSYQNNSFRGEEHSILRNDTIMPPTEELIKNLYQLESNKFIRHKKVGDCFEIRIYSIVQNTDPHDIKVYAERHLFRYLIDFVQDNYPLYSSMKSTYLNQYEAMAGIYVSTNIRDLVMEGLARFWEKYEPSKQ